jgi:hypothetical protein
MRQSLPDGITGPPAFGTAATGGFDAFTVPSRDGPGAADPAKAGAAGELPRRRSPAKPDEPVSEPVPPTAAEPARPVTIAANGDELPRRVRQASLAPQLRKSPPLSTPPTQPQAPADSASLSDIRNTMSAMQRGWQQGRAEIAQRGDSGPEERQDP